MSESREENVSILLSSLCLELFSTVDIMKGLICNDLEVNRRTLYIERISRC